MSPRSLAGFVVVRDESWAGVSSTFLDRLMASSLRSFACSDCLLLPSSSGSSRSALLSGGPAVGSCNCLSTLGSRSEVSLPSSLFNALFSSSVSVAVPSWKGFRLSPDAARPPRSYGTSRWGSACDSACSTSTGPCSKSNILAFCFLPFLPFFLVLKPGHSSSTSLGSSPETSTIDSPKSRAPSHSTAEEVTACEGFLSSSNSVVISGTVDLVSLPFLPFLPFFLDGKAAKSSACCCWT